MPNKENDPEYRGTDPVKVSADTLAKAKEVAEKAAKANQKKPVSPKDAAAKVKAAIKTQDEKAKAGGVAPKLSLLAKAYAKNYPKVERFYITSDGQVFLPDSKDYARMHQNGLTDGEPVRIFDRNGEIVEP